MAGQHNPLPSVLRRRHRGKRPELSHEMGLIEIAAIGRNSRTALRIHVESAQHRL
jgi:hypothetical protein